ncbi:hypothetical protein M513_12464 [Trichuris suis]|uniref:RRM domain-containing protein n=1 Tax=Trichuris suis TaxID=68888 RepID=A0A085LNV9_9BILA|nr:hypothetical protein M513_12464 [Trichuris suis]
MFAVCKYIHHRHYMYAVETLDITNTFFIGHVYHVYGVDTGNIPCIQLHLHDRYYLYVEETNLDEVPGTSTEVGKEVSRELTNRLFSTVHAAHREDARAIGCCKPRRIRQIQRRNDGREPCRSSGQIAPSFRDLSAMQSPVVEMPVSVALCKNNLPGRSSVQKMCIMAYLGDLKTKSYDKRDEVVLCTLELIDDRYLRVTPDFNDQVEEPYLIYGRTGTYYYTVQDVSEVIEKHDEPEGAKAKVDLSRSSELRLSYDFDIPVEGCLRIFLLGEIAVYLNSESAVNFEYSNLFIAYCLEIPKGWSCQTEKRFGVTQLSSATYVQNAGMVSYFAMPLEFELMLDLEHYKVSDEHPEWPLLFIAVMSMDNLSRYRLEGYGYAELPRAPGREQYVVKTWRPIEQGVENLQRFFLGGSTQLESITLCRYVKSLKVRNIWRGNKSSPVKAVKTWKRPYSDFACQTYRNLLAAASGALFATARFLTDSGCWPFLNLSFRYEVFLQAVDRTVALLFAFVELSTLPLSEATLFCEMSCDEKLSQRLWVRGSFHQLLSLIENMKLDSAPFDANRLSEIMSESNSLLQLVDRPYECSLDTSVVKGVAEIMLEGSSGLSTNLREFNPEEFGSKLIAFVSGRNDESTFAYLDILNSDFNKWAAFGADCAAQMHLVSAPLSYHCLSANSGAEVGLAKRKRRRRSGSAESPIAGSVRRVVLESASQEADTTTRACEHVYNHLKRAYRNNKKKPVDFFRFILHPTKFSTTVENLFHLTFLVHDGLVNMVANESGISLEPLKPHGRFQSAEQRLSNDDNSKAAQSVLSLSVREWKTAKLIPKFHAFQSTSEPEETDQWVSFWNEGEEKFESNGKNGQCRVAQAGAAAQQENQIDKAADAECRPEGELENTSVEDMARKIELRKQTNSDYAKVATPTHVAKVSFLHLKQFAQFSSIKPDRMFDDGEKIFQDGFMQQQRALIMNTFPEKEAALVGMHKQLIARWQKKAVEEKNKHLSEEECKVGMTQKRPLLVLPKDYIPVRCKPPVCNPYIHTVALALELARGDDFALNGLIDFPVKTYDPDVELRFPLGGSILSKHIPVRVVYGHHLSAINPFGRIWKTQRKMLIEDDCAFQNGCHSKLFASMAPKQLQKGSSKTAPESSLSFSRAPQTSGNAVLKSHLADPSACVYKTAVSLAARKDSKDAKKRVHWEIDQDNKETASFSSLAKERLRNQRVRFGGFSNFGEDAASPKVPWNCEAESSQGEDKFAKDEKLTAQKSRTAADENLHGASGDDPTNLSAGDSSDESDPLAIIKFPEELTDSERLLKQSFEIYSLTAKLVQEHSKCETDMKLRIPIPQEVAAATEEAKRLVKAGTMTVQKAEQRTTFKRPVKLARRLERVGNGLIPSKQAEPFDSGFNYSFDEAIFPGNTNIYNRPSNSGTYYATESCIPNSSSLSSEKSSAEPFSKSVYIRSGHISEESIRDCFSKFGTIVGIKRGVYDKSAIVDFETSRAASAAVEEMNGRHIDGLPLTVSIANAQLCRAFNEYPPFLSEAQKPACPDSRHAVCYEDEEQ